MTPTSKVLLLVSGNPLGFIKAFGNINLIRLTQMASQYGGTTLDRLGIPGNCSHVRCQSPGRLQRLQRLRELTRADLNHIII
jgi:hypothetical protein